MKEEKIILEELEQISQKLEIEVIYDNFFGKGGLCKCKDRYYFIINENLSLKEKTRLFLEGLSSLSLDNVWLPPRIRELLNTE